MFLKVDNLTACDDKGSVVKPLHDLERVLYERAGRQYLIPKESERVRDDYVHWLYLKGAYEKGACGKPLALDLLQDMERDLKDAYKVLGMCCKFAHP